MKAAARQSPNCIKKTTKKLEAVVVASALDDM